MEALSCENRHADCPQLVRGFPFLCADEEAQHFCALSCGVCTPDFCEDHSPDCQGIVTSFPNYCGDVPEELNPCKVACELCPGAPSTSPSVNPTPNPSTEIPSSAPTASPSKANMFLTVTVTTADGKHVETYASMFVEFVDAHSASSGVLSLFPAGTLTAQSTVYTSTLDFGSDPTIDLENLKEMYLTLGQTDTGTRTRLWSTGTAISLHEGSSEIASFHDKRKKQQKLTINKTHKPRLLTRLTKL